MATKKAATKPPGPLKPPPPAYEFLLVSVPLDDLSQLNEYGREGWTCAAIVGRDVNEFQALLQREAH